MSYQSSQICFSLQENEVMEQVLLAVTIVFGTEAVKRKVLPRSTECGTGLCNPSILFSQLEMGLLNRCGGISAEKSKENLDTHKRKAYSTEEHLVRGWVERGVTALFICSPAEHSQEHYLFFSP